MSRRTTVYAPHPFSLERCFLYNPSLNPQEGNEKLYKEVTRLKEELILSNTLGYKGISLLGKYKIDPATTYLYPNDSSAYFIGNVDWTLVKLYDLARILINTNQYDHVQSIEFFRFNIGLDSFPNNLSFSSFVDFLDKFLMHCKGIDKIIFTNSVFDEGIDPAEIEDLKDKYPFVEIEFKGCKYKVRDQETGTIIENDYMNQVQIEEVPEKSASHKRSRFHLFQPFRRFIPKQISPRRKQENRR